MINVRNNGGKKQKEEVTMSVISMKKLLEVGVHFGHQTKRWNPKMAPYIFTSRNGIYIIENVDKLDILPPFFGVIGLPCRLKKGSGSTLRLIALIDK